MTDIDERIARLETQCRRAEDEYPHLAAPDGTVAVPFTDLRAALTEVSNLRRQVEAAKDGCHKILHTLDAESDGRIYRTIAAIEHMLRSEV